MFFFKIYLEGRKVKDLNLNFHLYCILWKYDKIGIKVNQILQRIITKVRIPCFDLGENFLFWNKQYTSYSLFATLSRVVLLISFSQFYWAKRISEVLIKITYRGKTIFKIVGLSSVLRVFFVTMVSVVIILIDSCIDLTVL